MPLAEFVGCIRQQACALKAERRVQCDGDRVDSENAGHHGVAGSFSALSDQLREQELADSMTDAVRAHVNGIFDGALIGFTRAELRSITITDNVALKLGDKIGQLAITRGTPAAKHLGLFRKGDLGCCGACGDEERVDGSDVGNISRSGWTDEALRRAVSVFSGKDWFGINYAAAGSHLS